jgi:hypothetical protein
MPLCQVGRARSRSDIPGLPECGGRTRGDVYLGDNSKELRLDVRAPPPVPRRSGFAAAGDHAWARMRDAHRITRQGITRQGRMNVRPDRSS